ncbi:MAG: divergent polysaccharide deacetylase family protein [Dialister invisus]|uniref:divergent polysaccharide deacetylase family protein n=1 Tax=Dialister invisus TaxID=218538 RepID=UPI0039918C05
MAERKRTLKRTSFTGKRKVVRRRKKSRGHSLLLLLFFLVVISVASCTVAHPFSDEKETMVSVNTAIHHLFGEESSERDRKGKIGGRVEEVKKEPQSIIKEFMNRLKGGENKGNNGDGNNILTKREEKNPSDTRLKASAAKQREPAEKKAGGNSSSVTGRLAVVIDDAGLDLESQRIYEEIGVPLTLAVMPNKMYTSEAAAEWSRYGMPVILHQPMEPVSGSGMEEKTILTSMSDEAIRYMLKESLEQIPQAVGINNHQGSRATTDARVMRVVMNELSHRELFFFDSRTNTTTAADSAAASYGVPYARNDLFVDNSADEGEIRAMIQEGANRAKARGSYIIIGHCRPHTAAAFRDIVPQLQAQGIEFVYVSSLLRW